MLASRFLQVRVRVAHLASGRSCAAACSARRAARSCAGRLLRRSPRLPGSRMSPNSMACAGQACWQAVCTSPSTSSRAGELRVDPGPIDALHAVRALLHDAARAHRDVGILRQLEDVGRVLREVEEVEPPHLVRAVVRAVAGADAAVVHHHVQALAVVHGRRHRADLLARRVLALLAGHGLEDDRLGRRRARRRSSGRRGSSASRARARPGPCRRPACCSRSGRRRCRRCSRCRCSGRSSSPTGGSSCTRCSCHGDCSGGSSASCAPAMSGWRRYSSRVASWTMTRPSMLQCSLVIANGWRRPVRCSASAAVEAGRTRRAQPIGVEADPGADAAGAPRVRSRARA